MGYRQANRHADFTLVSHDHWDHNHLEGVQGRTRGVTGSGAHRLTDDVSVRGVLAEHDAEGGRRFGLVNLFAWTMDGIRVAFLSDLGHVLRAQQLAELGPADVVLVPVGGHYTLDASGAKAVVRQFPDARVVIPMHYRTPSLARERFPVAGVEPFLQGYRSVRQVRGGEVTLDRSKLPAELEVFVLTPTC